MQTTKKAMVPVLLATLFMLSGCFSLSRSAPPARHYVLGEGRQSEIASPVGKPDPLMVGLRQPRLADYLTNPFIVVRGGAHQIGFSELDRWGEDLAGGISRAVVGHMIAREPLRRVEQAPWPAGSDPHYLIQLNFLHFEGVLSEDPAALQGEVYLQATWEILRRQDGALLARGSTEVREGDWTVGDFEGLVTLLDAGLGTLADDLLLSLSNIPDP